MDKETSKNIRDNPGLYTLSHLLLHRFGAELQVIVEGSNIRLKRVGSDSPVLKITYIGDNGFNSDFLYRVSYGSDMSIDGYPSGREDRMHHMLEIVRRFIRY